LQRPAAARGLVSWPGRSAEFRDNLDVAVSIGEQLGCRAFNALYGNRVPDTTPERQDELAVGAQFNLPYVHIVVKNSYLGLIRQSQRGFDMDYAVQLSFDNVNAPELAGYGVDHVKVAEGLGCKGLRVYEPAEMVEAFETAQKLMAEHRLPVVVEIMLERITLISMGTELDNITEFEELAEHREHAPTSVALLD
jgi:tartronate-semialdehyde synthase